MRRPVLYVAMTCIIRFRGGALHAQVSVGEPHAAP